MQLDKNVHLICRTTDVRGRRLCNAFWHFWRVLIHCMSVCWEGKGTADPLHALNVHGGSGGTCPLILNLAVR